MRNIIDRLHGLISGNSRETIVKSIVGDTVLDQRVPGIVPERFNTVALTPADTFLKGIRSERFPLGEMLVYGRSGVRTAVTIKLNLWDPAVFVWISTVRPRRQWIAVASAAERRCLSFAHQAAVREFMKAQNLHFSTDERRWEAYHQLRRKWQMLAGQNSSP